MDFLSRNCHVGTRFLVFLCVNRVGKVNKASEGNMAVLSLFFSSF
jgi:hypothetical protein